MAHPDGPHSPASLPHWFRTLFWVRIALLTIALLVNVAFLTSLIALVPGTVVFAIAIVAYAVISLIFWRCPTCGKYPGSSVVPDMCERCGARLFGLDRARSTPNPTQPLPGPHRSILPLIIARAAFGIVIFAIFASLGMRPGTTPAIVWGLTIATMALGAWLEWRWWRCPHCGGYLKRSIWPGRTCTKCGGALL